MHAAKVVALAGLGLLLWPPFARAQEPPRENEYFRTADVCLACHNNLSTPAGADISIGNDWRASMMANSARDPYWQAAVRREIMDHPAARAEIEDTCSTCHMPITRFNAHAAGGKGEIFTHLNEPETPASRAALDGVTCTVCHQIQPEKLGTRQSFTGGFAIDTTTPWGQRPIFGPFQVDSGRKVVMRSATRFVPSAATHIQSSDLCATCHTLFTETLGPRGEVLGTLPEQTPFLEWRHSAYRTQRSCQSCHMPVVTDSVPITSVLGQPRSGVSRHVFRGGNFFVIRMLNRFRDELQVTALPQEMEAEADRTIEHLQTLTARVSIEHTERRDQRLVAEVAVHNTAGHKLPTAYPSRRAWLHVTVRDSAGRTLFQSGAFRPDGSIEGNDNDEDARRYERHYDVIERSNQVQVYESILVDPGGAVTTGLLTGLRYAKDNRLLPTGFDKHSAGKDIAVYGQATGDRNFEGGGDRVRYAIDIGPASGPITIDVKLWYQPIGFRWAQNLAPYDALETRRFLSYFNQMADHSAVVLASAQATVN
jgi:hypothetical protein